VVVLGVGDVEKNTVVNIPTFKQVKNSPQEKTTMTQTAVAKRKGSKKTSIVLGAIQAIAASVGNFFSNNIWVSFHLARRQIRQRLIIMQSRL